MAFASSSWGGQIFRPQAATEDLQGDGSESIWRAETTSLGSIIIQTLRARPLLGAKGIATRSDRTLLGAPGLTTSNKKQFQTRIQMRAGLKRIETNAY